VNAQNSNSTKLSTSQSLTDDFLLSTTNMQKNSDDKNAQISVTSTKQAVVLNIFF